MKIKFRKQGNYRATTGKPGLSVLLLVSSAVGVLLQSVNVLEHTIIVHQLCCPWLHLPWAAVVHRVNDFAFPTDGPSSNSTLRNTAVGEQEGKSP